VARSRFPLPGDPLTAGIDEAGRGPLAGPLVVAAVILDPARRINGIADSKQLTEAEREKLYVRIVERAIAWSVVVVEVEEIDRINIFQATMHGMRRALLALRPAPELALIDGNRLPPELPCAARAIVGGDDSEPAIGAASILAKVTRDRLMYELDAHHPAYGFARHKGYSTPEHFEALRLHGPCVLHRRSFAPVRATMQPGLDLALED
jgi:ribonuclease HII